TGLEHGGIESEVAFVLRSYLSDHPIGRVVTGEVLCRLKRDPDTSRAADVAFIRKERLPEEHLTPGPFEGAPDLVVEIISPNDTASEVQRKASEWLEAGAAVVWLLYPATRGVLIGRPNGSSPELRGDAEVDAEPVLPGFRCRARDLFAGPF
ncbi:MAG: Uma2 family endonuclease, partial [Chloroflexota bacterium]